MERNPSSSDDDAESLIPPPDKKTKPPRRLKRTFEISSPSNSSRHQSRSAWYCVLILSASFLLAAVLLFIDARRHFATESSVGSEFLSANVRIRDSELLALNLLKNQQIELLRLWNLTSAGKNSTQFDPTLENFRASLIKQINLNRRIQNTLLSSNSIFSGNYSSEFAENGENLSSGVDFCRKIKNPEGRRTIKWNPQPKKFLLMICLSGQMSNHLICLQKHMFFAALLDRTLIIPSPKFDYQYDKVIDLENINKCLGKKAVISFEEFSKNRKLEVNKFICYMTSPPCFVDDEHAKRLRSLGLSLPKLEAAFPEDPKSEKKRGIGDIRGKFSCKDDVLAVGDLFYADVEEDWVMQEGGPIEHDCKTLIQPSKMILLTAQRFVQTFLGRDFLALHFRRHGFLQFCNAKEESCFFPVPQAAECVLRVVEKSNARVIYLSTDAASSETDVLQSLLVMDGRSIPLIKRPAHNSAEKWDALLFRNHLGEDNQIEAMLDKTICAMADVFIGSSGSTFTDDIFRLRKDWGVASICDENLCHGEQPNFIAFRE